MVEGHLVLIACLTEINCRIKFCIPDSMCQVMCQLETIKGIYLDGYFTVFFCKTI